MSTAPATSSNTAPKTSVLFVCLGNICRSPMAHATLLSLRSSHPRLGHIDSCGTGAYHTLEPPDSRTMDVLEKHGIADFQHGARKLRPADFTEFDYVLAMDGYNLRDCERVRDRAVKGKDAAKVAKVMLFGDFAGNGKKGEVVEDPYYGGKDGFETAFEQCMRFSKNFVKEVVQEGATNE